MNLHINLSPKTVFTYIDIRREVLFKVCVDRMVVHSRPTLVEDNKLLQMCLNNELQL